MGTPDRGLAVLLILATVGILAGWLLGPSGDHSVGLPAARGDVEAGALAYREQGMECHRYNGHGEIAFKSAPLTGLPDWYLEAQMTKYLEGIRGYHPEDERGKKMRAMALRPANAEDIANIIVFLNTLGEEYPLVKGGR